MAIDNKKVTSDMDILGTNSSTHRGGDLRVEMRAHGSGISAELQRWMLRSFAQADSSGTRMKGGNGLGLHIFKAIIEQPSGIIGFGKMPGGGQTSISNCHWRTHRPYPTRPRPPARRHCISCQENNA